VRPTLGISSDIYIETKEVQNEGGGEESGESTYWLILSA